MATMHYLFFGILSVAVFVLGNTGDAAVSDQKLLDSYAESRRTDPVAGHEDAASLKCYSGSDMRERIVALAVQEIGVREATGSNDGRRIEEYLAYTGLGKGYAWCAAFASWCYGRAGRSAPRNAWSPALFPKARRYTKDQVKRSAVRPADLFAIYSQNLKRINHVGIVHKKEGNWIITVEGNSANCVLTKRRPSATIYAFSNWLD